MPKLIKNKSGMTLIETIVALVVASIFMMGLVTVFITTMRVIGAAKDQADAGTMMTNIGEVITNEIAYASHIDSTELPGTITFSKSDMTNVTLKTDRPAGEDIDILYLNGKPVFDVDYYKGSSLSLNFYVEDGVVVVNMILSGRVGYATTISIRPLNIIG